MDRREFLRTLGAVPALGLLGSRFARAAEASNEKLPRIVALTQGPRIHWFVYYDKFRFSTDDRFALADEVVFGGRSPRGGDTIRVGMVYLQDGDRWIELGTTRAWNWQQ